MVEQFTVKTDAFEGPLELLLSLVEKRKLYINDISLADVADEYVEYVRTLGSHSIAISAQFIYIASTLLLIKSKSLLPTLELTSEEIQSVDELEHRLRLLSLYRELSNNVRERYGVRVIYPKQQKSIRRIPIFSPDAHCNRADLRAALDEVLAAMPKRENRPKAMVRPTLSLESVINDLRGRVMREFKTSFRDFSGHGSGTERVRVIVSFLAILELVKQGDVRAQQESTFADISMEMTTIAVPRYD